ncbi:MAG TPA: protein kinase [Kofleriaceae bacterium]
MAINDDQVADLIAAGKHADAARAALEAGQPARAADLYEKLWDFRAALEAARAAGDLPRALRYAIEVRDEPAAAELTAQLSATDDGARSALDVLVRMRRHAEAAALAERLGDSAKAIDLYTRAHKELDAARLLEGLGRDRDAGRLLERAVDLAAPSEKPAYQLALGRILARRGAYPEATRLLQDARRHPELPAELRAETQRHLIATLAAMGLRDGARDALLELRATDPSVPADLDTYLRGWRDQAAERRATSRDREVIAGRYRLERLLGAGASGRVFLATDEIAGRSVALKMFFASSARGGPAYERFVREARLASTLRHPSLVEVYDVSVERGFLVMEYLPGGSLAQRLGGAQENGEPSKLAAAQVRRMALDLIGGLEAAHHRGVVHRDVKPANIFFDARGTAKLGDFGVAHLVDLGQTQTGGLIGTLAYMSPEQITGAPISIAADLYALGVTLFEALTGRLPFLGPDFVAQHLGEPAPAPSSVAADVEPGWDELIAGLLVKNPRERTPTLGELRHQLEALDLGGRPQIGPRQKRTSTGPHSIAALAADGATRETGPRYQFETPLGATPLSQLARAVDTVLDRSVVIERFLPGDGSGDDATRALDHVRELGRAQSPFVQRALSFDRATRTIIFEAPSGATLIEAPLQLPAADAVRLLKRLARGVASLHRVPVYHGAINQRTVVFDEGAVPTILCAGLGAVGELTPASDVAAIIAIVAGIAGAEPTADALARALCEQVGARVPAYAPPGEGVSMYAFADALDVAVLGALGAK